MKLNRRRILAGSLFAVAAAPFVFAGRQIARAAEVIYKKAELAEEKKNPLIASLKYVADATTSKDRTADKMGVKAADQICKNCSLYAAPGTLEGTKDEVGKCVMFQNQLVHAKGWCNVWSKKA